MRSATVLAALGLATAAAACTDLREFRGEWHGKRVGTAASVRVGVPDEAEASLAIDALDQHGLEGRLTVDGLVAADTPFASLPGAEADTLANMTFSGGPIRVYLGFAPAVDGAGDALVLVALYDDHRVELRLLRGGTAPSLYGIFELSEAS